MVRILYFWGDVGWGGGDVGRGVGGDQAYSRLSTIHGHITDCKLDSVVYMVYVCELMWTFLVWRE